MGWISLQKPHGVSVIDFIEEDYYRGADKIKVVARNSGDGAVYFAIKNVETGFVKADIFSIDFNSKSGELSYKPMDECSGPCYYGASQKVLNSLSDTINKYALKWRKKCRSVIFNKKLTKSKTNDIVELVDSSSYDLNGTRIQFLKVVNLKKNLAYPMMINEDGSFSHFGNSSYNFIGFNRRIKRVALIA